MDIKINIELLNVKDDKSIKVPLELKDDEDYKEIVKKITKGKTADANGIITLKLEKVEDVSRYRIIYKTKKWVLQYRGSKDGQNWVLKKSRLQPGKFWDKKFVKQEDVKTVVILLESPHKDEYEGEKPIGPAQGKTGDNIQKELINVVKHIVENDRKILVEKEKYNFIICNPIQYQTSLYMYHNEELKNKYKTLRNKCWSAIWKANEIRSEFQERLKKYNPALIINACTSDLQDKVSQEVKSIYKDIPIYTTYHPSYWMGYNITKVE